jgi:hypothetical protein
MGLGHGFDCNLNIQPAMEKITDASRRIDGAKAPIVAGTVFNVLPCP